MWRLPLFLVAVALFAEPCVEPACLLNFNQHYVRFFRKYMGCIPHASTTKDCRPAEGTLDVKELKASCEAAKNLFGLQGKC